MQREIQIGQKAKEKKTHLLIVGAHCQVSYPLMPKAKLGRNTGMSVGFVCFRFGTQWNGKWNSVSRVLDPSSSPSFSLTPKQLPQHI